MAEETGERRTLSLHTQADPLLAQVAKEVQQQLTLEGGVGRTRTTMSTCQ